MSEDYYLSMQEKYKKKRAQFVFRLQQLGFEVVNPEGAYYVLADYTRAFNFKDDVDACEKILKATKVAVVPGSSFFMDPLKGRHLLRFCYAISEDKLERALEMMSEHLNQFRK